MIRKFWVKSEIALCGPMMNLLPEIGLANSQFYHRNHYNNNNNNSKTLHLARNRMDSMNLQEWRIDRQKKEDEHGRTYGGNLCSTIKSMMVQKVKENLSFVTRMYFTPYVRSIGPRQYVKIYWLRKKNYSLVITVGRASHTYYVD